jgi:hypothetical protein
MAIFRFPKSIGGNPTSPSDDAMLVVETLDSDRVVDEVHDDLHREMKPRQLSESCLFLVGSSC